MSVTRDVRERIVAKPVQITDRDHDRLRRLLMEALRRRLSLDIRSTETGISGQVDSYSRPGLRHDVDAWLDDAGRLWASCSCEATDLCTHLSLALTEPGEYGEPPMLDLEQRPVVTDDEQAELNERFADLFSARGRRHDA